MSQPSPDARHLARAVDALTTQVRRIADTVSTPAAIVSDAPTTTADDTQPTLRDQHRATWNTLTPAEQAARLAALDTDDTGEDEQRTARRASLRVILDRASRGVILRTDEAALLRQHVDAEQRDADTARAELEQAQAAIKRVRAQATAQRARGASGSTDHKIGRYDAAVAILAALDGTEQPTTR